MIGKPKFKKGDKVSFVLEDKSYSGSIYIVDKYGTFEDSSDVSYDIIINDAKYKSPTNPEGEILVKHVKESLII